MASWDSTRVRAQLRLTAQRLGQLQSRKDSEGQITRRDIATLLSQSNVALARAKAQKLLREEAMSDVLETLEMHVGVILEHLGELENSTSPSPPVVEAASSIIFAAPQTESKDLQIVRDILAHRLGVDFVRSAEGNRDSYVSTRTARGLDPTPASAAALDEFMYGIARANGVQWRPALRPREKLNALSEILDPESTNPIIDLPRLRVLSARGIPSHPPWLRPRIWRLFFGTLPVLRSSWEVEARKQRDSYYDLVRRLLEPLASLPSPTTPLSSPDENVMNVYQQLARVPQNLFEELEGEPEATPGCPVDDSAPDDIYIACASNLDVRLRIIQGVSAAPTPSTPEIRLESTPEIRLEPEPSVPDISLTEPQSSPTKQPFASKRTGAPTTLLHSKILTASGTHPRHASALLRLLYIHSCLNPANRSPHVASLLVPLYSVLIQEIEAQDMAHVEADTFWVFEAMISEFADLADEDSGVVWMQKFSQTLAWADDELHANLHAKGLDPSLPHYSYRWLAPLLAHTLPLSSVLPVWDTVFSRPPSTRNSNLKTEHLIDICTSMLIRAKGPLFALGKASKRSPSLWSEENVAAPPPSPLRQWEANDAFLEGMSLLQRYPIDAAGGVDGVLQTASDLLERREAEASSRPTLGLGARLRDTMWRGFTNQPASPLPEDDEPRTPAIPSPAESPNRTSEAANTGWRSRLSETVWKGITNQTAMEAPPSPTSPLSPSPSRPPSPSLPPSPSPLRRDTSETLHPSSAASPEVTKGASIWGYASKLKDSDTAAQLAKVSSNWTAKAMEAWAKKPATSPPPTSDTPTSARSSASGVAEFLKRSSVSSNGSQAAGHHSRQSSLASAHSDPYSPPPRPAYFRPPRDSFMPAPRRESSSASSTLASPEPDVSPTHSEGGIISRAKHLQDSLASLTGSIGAVVAPQPKSAPRPLLLGGNRSAVTGHSPSRSISRAATPTGGHQRQYSETPTGRSPHRDSQSSVSSSLAPSDAWRASAKTEWDSDGGLIASKVVPLRRSMSPMAPGFRMTLPRTQSVSSTGSSGPRDSMISQKRDSSESVTRPPRVDTITSPTLSSPALETPVSQGSGPATANSARVGVTLTDLAHAPGPAATPVKLTRKRTPPRLNVGDTSDSAGPVPPVVRSPRIRSKRQIRPPHLRLEENEPLPPASSQDSLKPRWPEMPDETDTTVTPRAASFDDAQSSPSPPPSAGAQVSGGVSIKRARKVSARSNSGDSRTRKISGNERRTRKVSTEGREHRAPRDSEGEHGDDEGYDDLLSAYESEDASEVKA